MKELIELNNFCETIIENQAEFILTKVSSSHTLAVNYANRGCCYHDKAYFVLDGIEPFSTIYLVVDSQGKVEQVLLDKEGMLPELFLAPNDSLWVKLVPYDPDKEFEITLPLFSRNAVELPKANRPFVGSFIGSNNTSSYFYNDGYDSKQAAKVQAITFQQTTLIQKNTIKIPLPNTNKTYVADEGLHLLNKEAAVLLHRLVDAKGNVLQARSLSIEKLSYCFEVVTLSFKEDSWLITFTPAGTLYLMEIEASGKVTEHLLTETTLDIFSIWAPVFLSANTYIVNFTHALGNGWFVIRDKQLIECYVGNDNIYTELMTDKKLSIACNKPVITGVCKTVNNGYCLGMFDKDESLFYLLNKVIT